MKIERVKEIPEFPLAKGSWDAVWVLLNERETPHPLTSELLRDLDWRLQGVLSRYALAGTLQDSKTLTYVPIEGRMGARFLVIDSGKNLSRKSLESVSLGIQAKKILVWSEDGALNKWLEKQWPTLGKGQVELGELEEIAWGDDSIVAVASGDGDGRERASREGDGRERGPNRGEA